MFLSSLGRLLLVSGDSGRLLLALSAAETGAIADDALGFRRNPDASMGSGALDVGGRGTATLLALMEEVRLAVALREAGRRLEATGGLRGLARVPELLLAGAERAWYGSSLCLMS